MPMTRPELLKMHEELCNDARELMTKKNHDYSGPQGDDPFANFRRCEAMGICTPLQGALVRLTDKFSRLSTYATAGRLLVEDETVDDTILDLINYAVLCGGIIRDMRERSKMAVRLTEPEKPMPFNWLDCPICHEQMNGSISRAVHGPTQFRIACSKCGFSPTKESDYESAKP